MKTFLQALEEGDSETVNKWIQAGININKPCSNNLLPIFIITNKIVMALHHGVSSQAYLTILDKLLTADANSNSVDKALQTPLHQLSSFRELFGLFAKKASDSKQKESISQAVELLLTAGADLNAKDGGGNTPLMLALQNRNNKVAHLLITKGAKIDDASYAKGTTILHYASQAKTSSLLEAIFKAVNTLDVNIKDQQGMTPLDYAFSLDNIFLLLQQNAIGTRFDSVAYLSRALDEKHQPLRDYLLAQGVAKQTGKTGFTALHDADTVESVEILLRHGADINALGEKENATPLLYQVKQRAFIRDETKLAETKAILDTLIKHGADIHHVDSQGKNALHYAVSYNNKLIAEYLLTHHINIDQQDKAGNTPLHTAVANCSEELIHLLLSYNAKTTLLNHQQCYALEELLDNNFIGAMDDRLQSLSVYIVKLLHSFPEDRQPANSAILWSLAMWSGSISLAELLLKRKVDINIEHNGEPGWHVAIRKKHLGLLKWLIVHPIDINASGSKTNMTALQWTVSNMNAALVKRLIASNADIKINDKDNNNLLHLLL